jgi:spore germination protein GerM
VIRTGLGRKIVIVIITFVVIVLVVSYLIPLMREREREGIAPEVQRVSEETRSVTLFFVNEDADKLLTEMREVAVEGRLEEQIRAVVSELLKGPEDDDKVSVFPEGVIVQQAFWVEETQTVYLDFNRALVTNHRGGSTAEYYTISTVLKTIGANFPQIRLVQFLVDGYPVETIAGHYAIDEPLDILRWR